MDRFVRRFDQQHRFTAADIRIMHRTWLGEIYAWAGEYRSVNMSKDGFPFATAGLIPDLMLKFQKRVLSQPDSRKAKDGVLRGNTSWNGPKLPAHGRDLRRAYRAEPRRTLTGKTLGAGVSVLAIVPTLAPVSIAVELDTLVMRSRR